MTFFHVHHHGYGDTTSDPLVSRSSRVAYGRHITSLAGSDQARSRITQRIAVVCIVVGRSSTTAFVPEEVVLCSELADIFAFGLPFSQLLANHFRQQFFCFDQRNLYVSVWVAIQRQLTCHTFRQRSI